MPFVLLNYGTETYSNQDKCYWQKDRHVDQWNGNDGSEINTCTCGQLIINKATKEIQWGKAGSHEQIVWSQLDFRIQKDELKKFSSRNIKKLFKNRS